MRLVILGGSGASTPELFSALATWPGGRLRRPRLEVILVGRSADKLALVAAECRRRAPRDDPPVTVETATDRVAALEGAEVILNQVRIGGLAARAFDESFPQSEGLPGEETMGPGGFANALRTVPALRPTWTDIARVAPEALIINLTNPSGIVVAAAEREFQLQIVSTCDSPISHCTVIAQRLGRPVDEVRRRYVGLNHVGWYVPEAPSELDALSDAAVGLDPEDVFLHEAVAAPYVRYYVHPDRILARQRATPTRASVLMRLETDMLSTYVGSGSPEAPRRGAAWYGLAVLPLIDAWLHGSEEVLIAGLTINELGSCLPLGITLEQPVTAPAPMQFSPSRRVELPRLPAAMMAAHATYERLTVDTILEGANRRALTRALIANPLVVDADVAGRLIDQILRDSPAGAPLT